MAAQPELPNEKDQVVSLKRGSQTSSPAEFHDELPDPDVGKSDEERARLVGLLRLFFLLLADTLPGQGFGAQD